MGELRRAFVLIACVLGTNACVQPDYITCGDLVCPAGDVCAPGGCATPGDVAACNDVAEGTDCRATSGAFGTCVGGFCQSGLCGNGVVDAGEVCDDGNATSGDGCRADCGKVEMCGDGVLDTGEACDDGNANPADGCDSCVATAWAATALISGGLQATTAGLTQPYAVAGDRHGNVFVADAMGSSVYRIDSDGHIIVVAGGGDATGDGGSATSAYLQFPTSVAVDGIGNLFIAEAGRSRIRRVAVDTGIITTVTGSGSLGFTGDTGLASGAQIASARGVAVNGLGDIFIADTGNHRIRRIDHATNIITTIAGTGARSDSGDGGAALSATFISPTAIVVDPVGDLFIADADASRIRRIDHTTHIITTVAGTGTAGFSGDGVANAVKLDTPLGVALDATGTLYIADNGNNRIRRVSGTQLTTIAGTGIEGYGGDGQAATGAVLSEPSGVAIDSAGNIVVADTYNSRVRHIDAGAVITTIAGTGELGDFNSGGAATAVLMSRPASVVMDQVGNLYITDAGKVRRVDRNGVLTDIAGTSQSGFGGDGGPATDAVLDSPTGMVLDADGNVFVSDSNNNRVRRVDHQTGVITTVAGNGVYNSLGDGGAATSASLANPRGLALDTAGNLFIAEADSNRIRRVDHVTGLISTYAGTGAYGTAGDGDAATAAQLGSPLGLAFDSAGDLYIADTFNNEIRKVDHTTGIITLVVPTSSNIQAFGIAFDSSDNLYIADDWLNKIVRRDHVSGALTTIAGGGNVYFGDGGPATSAILDSPGGVVIDATGVVYFTDTWNSLVRRVTPGGIITTVAGQLEPRGTGPLVQAHLAHPQALAIGPDFTLVAGGDSGTVEAVWPATAWLGAVAGRYPQPTATGALARYQTYLFGTVSGVAYDPTTKSIYLTESSSNRIHVVTIVDATDPDTWTIAPLANTSGTEGFADGAAATAQFSNPTGLYLDPIARSLYVADTGNHVVRVIDLTAGTVHTIAGMPQTLGQFGDGGPATAALLFSPRAITRCENGDLFIADTGNNRIRRVSATTGDISTVLGDGTPASSGEGSPSSSFPVAAPLGLACDESGNLFATSTTAVRLLAADETGTVDGTGRIETIYGAMPRDQFPASVTSCLTGIAIQDATTLQVADNCTGVLVTLHRQPE